MIRPDRDRGPLAFAAMLGAVALIVGVKSASGSTTHPVSALAGTGRSIPPTPTPSATGPVAGGTGAGGRTVTGDTEDTRFGPVQVRLTLDGSRITDVVALQLPDDRPRDVEIDDYAVPQLRQEVLTAQSARIDAISGASFTSAGYAQSVQSALDRAHG